jgi:cytochrome oxidase Cu insertion factor (SCO1/SenC/PrrC family)
LNTNDHSAPVGELISFAFLNNVVDKKQVQGIFVTIDPERDKPQVIKNYISYFNKHLIGLTGSQGEIQQVAQQYRAHSVPTHEPSRFICAPITE